MPDGQLSDKQLQGRLALVQARRKRQAQLDMMTLMDAPWGRRLLSWLIFEQCQLGQVDFPAHYIKEGVSSGQHMAFRLGRQAVGAELQLLARELSPQLYLDMDAESNQRAREDIAIKMPSTKDKQDD